MTDRITLETPEAGRGLLRVSGERVTSGGDGGWRLSVRDNRGHYLTPDGGWQPTVNDPWFQVMPCADAPDGAGEVVLDVGSNLVDGIGGRGNGPKFQVVVQHGNSEQCKSTLEIVGSLKLSQAAMPPPVDDQVAPTDHSSDNAAQVAEDKPAELSRSDSGGSDDSTSTQDAPVTAAVAEQGPAVPSPPEPGPSKPLPGTHPRRWLWVVAASLASLIVVAFVVIEFWSSRDRAAPEAPPPPPPREPVPAQDQRRPIGLASVQAFLAGNPSPVAVFAEASRAARDGDCDAAGRLFHHAAADPVQAGQLARLQDPDGFIPSPCLTAPNPDGAQVNYERAAEAGDRACVC